MIKCAATKPRERIGKIKDILQELNLNKDEYVKEFGLSIADRPVEVDGRVLPVPQIDGVSLKNYQNNKVDVQNNILHTLREASYVGKKITIL